MCHIMITAPSQILMDRFLGRFSFMFNMMGELASGHINGIPDDIPDDGLVDHAPIFYAIHIWNSYMRSLR